MVKFLLSKFPTGEAAAAAGSGSVSAGLRGHSVEAAAAARGGRRAAAAARGARGPCPAWVRGPTRSAGRRVGEEEGLDHVRIDRETLPSCSSKTPVPGPRSMGGYRRGGQG